MYNLDRSITIQSGYNFNTQTSIITRKENRSMNKLILALVASGCFMLYGCGEKDSDTADTPEVVDTSDTSDAEAGDTSDAEAGDTGGEEQSDASEEMTDIVLETVDMTIGDSSKDAGVE
jgi:hypothetical protein|tara:strand:- start:7706 stop:8062 length:357 start_codon:yes stop_codon:yes gene_type:complete